MKNRGHSPVRIYSINILCFCSIFIPTNKFCFFLSKENLWTKHPRCEEKQRWVSDTQYNHFSLLFNNESFKHCILMCRQYVVFKDDTQLVQFFPRLKEEVHVAPKKERRERDGRRRENRGGRRRERPQTIQSHSIFEQGPADTVHKTGALLQLPFLFSGCKAYTSEVRLQVHFFPHNSHISLFRLAWCYRPSWLHHLSFV